MNAERPHDAVLACPVESCGRALVRGDRRFFCEAGHSFDLSRAGTVNLLTPKDKKSAAPGDPKEAVQARRRNLARGHGDLLRDAILAAALEAGAAENGTFLDVGSGDGFFTRAIAAALRARAFGLDLSPFAAEFATKANAPEDPYAPFFFVANADRRWPVRDRSVDLLTSITARRNPGEFARVLAPAGLMIVVVPADDDLIELREAALGERRAVGSATPFRGDPYPGFERAGHRVARASIVLDQAAIMDWLSATYRGAREARLERIRGLVRIETTASHEIFLFRRTRGDISA